jgi:hypothetical protein
MNHDLHDLHERRRQHLDDAIAFAGAMLIVLVICLIIF